MAQKASPTTDEHKWGDEKVLMTKPSGFPAVVRQRYVQRNLTRGWKEGYKSVKEK